MSLKNRYSTPKARPWALYAGKDTMNTPENINWLVRYWNRSKPLRAYCDAYRMNNFARNVRHAIAQRVNDYAPRGPSRNRRGTNNRRWRKYAATQPRVIFSTPFFDITE